MLTETQKLFRFLRTKPIPENTSEILALERTKLANERTFLSYVRSSLYLLLGGLALIQLDEMGKIRWLGYVALVFSIIFVTIGITRYLVLSKRLRKWNRILFVDAKEIPENKKEETREEGD